MNRYRMVMRVESADECRRIVSQRDDAAGVWVLYRDAEKAQAEAVNAVRGELHGRMVNAEKRAADAEKCNEQLAGQRAELDRTIATLQANLRAANEELDAVAQAVGLANRAQWDVAEALKKELQSIREGIEKDRAEAVPEPRWTPEKVVQLVLDRLAVPVQWKAHSARFCYQAAHYRVAICGDELDVRREHRDIELLDPAMAYILTGDRR